MITIPSGYLFIQLNMLIIFSNTGKYIFIMSKFYVENIFTCKMSRKKRKLKTIKNPVPKDKLKILTAEFPDGLMSIVFSEMYFY